MCNCNDLGKMSTLNEGKGSLKTSPPNDLDLSFLCITGQSEFKLGSLKSYCQRKYSNLCFNIFIC